MRRQRYCVRLAVVPLLVLSITMGPTASLYAVEPSRSWRQHLFDSAHDAWEVTQNASATGWKYSKGTAVTAYKVTADAAAPVLKKSRDITVDAAKVTWVYSVHRADDAWAWVVDRSDDATDWVVDKAGRTWAVSRDKTGEVCVWTAVRITNSGPVSYVKTKLDAGWRWTTDKSGKSCVWIKDHAIEISVVAVVVGTLAACYYFTNPDQPSPCSYQGIRESLVGKNPEQLTPLTVDAIAKQHFDTTANGSNYRRLFTSIRPIPDGYEVHHAFPQKYETTMEGSGVNIHNPWRLQGVDPQTHQAITRDWGTWDRNLGHTPAANEIIEFKKSIDAKYGSKLLEAGN